MAIPNILTKIYDTAWALLEARSVWAGVVKVGNRIKLNAKPEPWKKTFQDGDFPQAVLIFGSITDGQQPAQQIHTFGEVRGDPACTARTYEMPMELLLGLSHQDHKVADVTMLNLETLAAFREARPTLQTAIRGIASYASVKTFGPVRMDHDELANRQPNPPLTEWGTTPRPTTIFRIPMVLLFNGQANQILT